MTLPGAGVQFPVQLQQSIASNGIIHRFSEKVNMNISENVQSQQFKRWFGDWQNDPAHASKVVNAGAGADRAEPADHLPAADQERQREIPADAAAARQGSDPARAGQSGGGGKKFLRTLQRLGNAAGGPVAVDALLLLGQHRTIWQEAPAWIFGSIQSLENEGILYVPARGMPHP